MKLTIEQKPLAATLKKLSGVVENRNTMPALSHVAIAADANGTVTIKATDLDIEATATIAANITAPGGCTVSAKMLADFVTKLPASALVTMELDADARLHVSAGRASFTLFTLPISDFPQLASGDFASSFTVAAKAIADMIGNTIFATSTEEMKYYLQGVYIHPANGKTNAVATDGHKLARVIADIPHDFPGVIIPRKTCAEVVKSFGGDGLDEIQVSISETKIRFSTQHFTILSKVVDGQYPAYDRVIPTQNVNTATVSSDDLRAALERVTAAADDKTRAVKLSIADGEIIVTSRASNASASDAVACTIDGNNIDVGFNGGYLMELMRQIDGHVRIAYADNNTPVLFSPADGASDASNASALYLLMPMRVA